MTRTKKLAAPAILAILACAATAGLVFYLRHPGARASDGGLFRAFSLREANRLLEQGQLSAPMLRSLANISRFAGMVFDRQAGDVVLVGKSVQEHSDATLDDLAVALRSRLLKEEYPVVSIDMSSDTAHTKLQQVRFLGGIENTRFGADFLDADVTLKRYSLGLLQATTNVPSYLQLCEEAKLKEMAEAGQEASGFRWLSEQDSNAFLAKLQGRRATKTGLVQSRFWFYPMDEHSHLTERDDVFVIDELQVGVKVEVLRSSRNGETEKGGTPVRDESSEAFARAFGEHLEEISASHPKLRRLKILFDLVAIAEGIAHLGKDRPDLDQLLRGYAVEQTDTPKTYPLLTRVGSFHQGEGDQVMVLSGGVELKATLLALADGDPTALRDVALKSRPNDRSLSWDLPIRNWEMPNDTPTDRKAKAPLQIEQSQAPGFSIVRQSFGLGAAPGRGSFVFPTDLPIPAVPDFKPAPPTPFMHERLLPLRDIGGVDISPQPTSAGKADDSFRNDVLKSRPSEETLSWPAEDSAPLPRR